MYVHPVWASHAWLFGIFFVALILFHVVLVYAWPLGKAGWKRVDYIWLSMGLLGVSLAVASSRQTFAQLQLPAAEAQIETRAGWIEDRAQFGVSAAVCRQFVRSEYSPPKEEFDRIQREYDQLCAWFKTVVERLPDHLANRQALKVNSLGTFAPPTVTDAYALRSLEEAVREYNAALSLRNELQELGQRTDVEFALSILGPFLIGVAIALRMTKVTGELRIAA
jgi:hypothetical protein